MPNENDNIDNNLDEQIDDIDIFDDFNAGEPQTGKREPAKQSQVITKNLLSATSAFTKTAATEVAESMPKTKGLLGEIFSIKEGFADFKKEFKEQYTPTINEVRKAMYKSLPMAEKYIPKTLYDKIEKALAGYHEEVKQAQKSQEQVQSDAIAGSLAEIFEAQEEIRSGERTEDRVTDMVEKVTDAARHAETRKLLVNISNSLIYQNRFTRTTQTAWMKKMLELKYISVYTGRESLATTKIMVSMLETKLEELKHNNALPDWQKWNKTDLIHKARRDIVVGKAMKAMPTVKGYIGGIGKGLTKTAKTTSKGVLAGLKSQAQLMSSAADMQSQMPDEPTGQGTAFGKFLGTAGGKIFGRKFADRILPLIETTEDTSANISDTAFFKAKRLREKLEGKGTTAGDFLASFLPEHQESMDVSNELLQDPTQPVPLDRAMRQAIVEVIPAYLSKIAKYTRDTATGTSNEQEIYDPVTRKIVSKTEAMTSAKGQVFGKKGALSQDAMSAVGQLRTGFERNMPLSDTVGTFEDAAPEIFKFIGNSAIHNEILYPELIKGFAEGNKDATESTYIKKVFKGIENPKAIAQIISTSIYGLDGKLDSKVLRKIESSIVRASAAKSWRQRLPQMLEGHGAYGMFKEAGLLNDEGIVQDEPLSEMMTDVSPEELTSRMRSVSKSTSRQLSLREKQTEELKDDALEAVEKAQGFFGKLGRMFRKKRLKNKAWMGQATMDEEMELEAGDEYDTGFDDRSVEGDKSDPRYREYILGRKRRDKSATSGADLKRETIFFDNFLNLSKEQPLATVDTSGTTDAIEVFHECFKEYKEYQMDKTTGTEGIVEELKRFHQVKEDSDTEMITKMVEHQQYRERIDIQVLEALQDTTLDEESLSGLGGDVLERISTDIVTLTQDTIQSNASVLQRLDDIVAAAELTLEMDQARTTDMRSLVSITDNRLPKRVAGDTDMDGDREGSYLDQMRDRAAKKKVSMAAGAAGMFGGSRGRRPTGSSGDPRAPEDTSGSWMDWLPTTLALGAGGYMMGKEKIKQAITERGTGLSKLSKYGMRTIDKFGKAAKASKAYRLAAGMKNSAWNSKMIKPLKWIGSKIPIVNRIPGAAKLAGRALPTAGKFGRAFGKVGGPITAMAEMGYGALDTGLDAEKAEAFITDRETRMDALPSWMRHGPMAQSAMALGVDQWGKNWKEKGAVRGTMSNAWEAMGVFGNLGKNIGAAGHLVSDTVTEMKGGKDASQLLDALLAMNTVRDPIGWGDWQVVDWNKISALPVKDLMTLARSSKFSEDDQTTFTKIFTHKSKAAKKSRERAEAAAEVVIKNEEKKQAARTVTTASGQVVAEAYQPPKPTPKSESDKQALQEAQTATANKAIETNMLLLEEQRKANATSLIIAEHLEGVKGNTGKLEDIDKSLGKNLEKATETNMIVTQPQEKASSRPAVHRPSIDISQR